MPVRYDQPRLKCRFRCGHHILDEGPESWARMERHEAKCRKNPESERFDPLLLSRAKRDELERENQAKST